MDLATQIYTLCTALLHVIQDLYTIREVPIVNSREILPMREQHGSGAADFETGRVTTLTTLSEKIRTLMLSVYHNSHSSQLSESVRDIVYCVTIHN